MSESPPVFAVVGRVNKGKSSIISTLAEDDSVRIDREPGTTQAVRRYPVTVDGRTLFTLVDTPGFQHAGEVLAWLEGRGVGAADRPKAVADFVAAHRAEARFADEVRLLEPILEGAGILYVVDGAHPYRPNYEAEMEILRWTGRPRMALVNRIGPGDFSAQWRPALDQSFTFVRDFDAFSVTFEERMALLSAFRELDPAWRASVETALGALRGERRRRRSDAAAVLASLLEDALTFTLEVTVRDETELEGEKERLEQRFHDALRKREAKARAEIEQLYAHRVVTWRTADLDRPALRDDLFAEEVWRVLGLTPGQLVAAGAVGGAAVGGTIDAFVGGASFLAGTVIGAATGGGAALWSVGRRFARAHPVGPGVAGLWRGAQRYWSGGRTYRIGPHRGPAFPWVLLDRALVHYRSVATLTHARREAVELPAASGDGVVSTLGAGERTALERIFRALRRQSGEVPRRLRDELHGRMHALLRGLDPARLD